MRSAGLIALAVTLTSCVQSEAPAIAPEAKPTLPQVRLVELQPGAPLPAAGRADGYTDSAEAIGEGKRLFDSFNCSGCHFAGGGGIGPALMDEKWIYGHEPDNIFHTIVEGRPNGMPSYGGKIPDAQVWQLVAYVESLRQNKQ